MIRKSIIVMLTLAAVVTAAVYVANIWVTFYFVDTGGTNSIFVCGGCLTIVAGLMPGDYGCGWVDVTYQFFGMPQRDEDLVAIPLWIPLVVFGVYPTVVFIRGPLRRHRRRKRGLCVNCAYNLTGNVSGVFGVWHDDQRRMRKRVRQIGAIALIAGPRQSTGTPGCIRPPASASVAR